MSLESLLMRKGDDSRIISENVMLLLRADDLPGTTSPKDSSLYNRVVTSNNGAIITSDQAKWGSGSIYIPTPVTNTRFFQSDCYPGGLLDTDFTIATWVLGGANSIFHMDFGAANQYSGINMGPSGTYGSFAGGTWEVWAQFGYTATASIWEHVALVRKSNLLMGFHKGKKLGQMDIGANKFRAINPGRIMIGNQATTGGFSGYLDDFIVVKGQALWTDDFTPPTGPIFVG